MGSNGRRRAAAGSGFFGPAARGGGASAEGARAKAQEGLKGEGNLEGSSGRSAATGARFFYRRRTRDFDRETEGRASGDLWKHPGPGRGDVGKDKRRSADRIASKGAKTLLAKTELAEELGVFVDVLALHVVEELATAAGHLEEAAAAVEVLAVGAQVLGEVVDAGGEKRDLDLGRTGVFFVMLEGGDGFGTNGDGHV